LGNSVTTAYDDAGRQVAQTDALGHTTRFILDATGRQVETDYADGAKSAVAFAAPVAWRLVPTRPGRRPATNMTAWPFDRCRQSGDQRTEYGYDEAGNFISQKDANGHITRYEYDGLGRRTATVLPLGQRSSTAYDAAGNVKSTTDFSGATIQYQYDAMNRQTAKVFPDTTSVALTYTLDGQRATVTDVRGVTRYSYDARDRLLSRAAPDGTVISYTYDAAGNRTAVTTPVGTSRYTFGALTKLQPSPTRTAVSRITRMTKMATSRTHAAQQHVGDAQLRRAQSPPLPGKYGPSGVISSYRYTLDADGTAPSGRGHRPNRKLRLRRSLPPPGGTITDPVNGNRTIAYTYDPVGNRLIRNDSAEGWNSRSLDFERAGNTVLD